MCIRDRLLIKDAVPAFASAALSHEAKNLFGDMDIMEEKVNGQQNDTDLYDIAADINSPENDSGNFLIYCAVTGFFNICDNITLPDFTKYWGGISQTIGSLSETVDVGKNGGKYSSNSPKENNDDQKNSSMPPPAVLFLTLETKKILSAVYGEPKNTNIR